MKKSTMKQKGTVTVTITCPAPHTAAARQPLTVETVRHGDVEGWYTQDTFHRAPGETMPHLHRSGTRGHFDADLILTTDSQGQRTLTIVNRDIPFLLAAAGKTGLIG